MKCAYCGGSHLVEHCLEGGAPLFNRVIKETTQPQKYPITTRCGRCPKPFTFLAADDELGFGEFIRHLRSFHADDYAKMVEQAVQPGKFPPILMRLIARENRFRRRGFN